MPLTYVHVALMSPTSARRKPFRSDVMPSEAAILKYRIRKANPANLYTFSLTQMRKMAVPPVTIPKSYRSPRAQWLCVGGRQVPFTKAMWDRAQRQFIQDMLDRIHEHVVYD